MHFQSENEIISHQKGPPPQTTLCPLLVYKAWCRNTSLLVFLIISTAADAALANDPDEQDFKSLFNTNTNTDELSSEANANEAEQGINRQIALSQRGSNINLVGNNGGGEAGPPGAAGRPGSTGFSTRQAPSGQIGQPGLDGQQGYLKVCEVGCLIDILIELSRVFIQK